MYVIEIQYASRLPSSQTNATTNPESGSRSQTIWPPSLKNRHDVITPPVIIQLRRNLAR